MLCLEGFARYVAYIVENPESTQGKVLEVASCHVTGDQIAQAFLVSYRQMSKLY